jgi:glycosyltransferase involved in cell wall biosynthesis
MKARVLLVGNFLSTRTNITGVSEVLADRLRASGWTCLCVSSRLPKLARLGDMVTAPLRWRRRYDVASLDVFSGPAFTWAEACAAVLKALGKPFNLTLRGGHLLEFANSHPRRMRRLLASADSVVTPSHYLQRGLAGCRADMGYLSNGMAVKDYPLRLRDRSEPKLIWLRAFHRIYNPVMAVAVLAEVLKVYPTATLTMVGPDKQDGSLAQVWDTAARLGVSGRLTCPGGVPKDQVPGWLARGDIFLNTTGVESFGVSVMEAAACGLPIVTTDAGELPDLWQDGEDAILVPVGDAQAMSAAVVRILAEPGLAGRLSLNARAKAEAFDWQYILPQWEALLMRLAKRA